MTDNDTERRPILILAAAEMKFPLGELVITANALGRITHEDCQAGLTRHAQGDWGDICPEDRELNDLALQDGSRLLSVYKAGEGTPFWIITEADRSVTTILLPEDY